MPRDEAYLVDILDAARKVSNQTRQKFPQLPWRAMVDMRNVMIHAYDTVDLHVVWNTVQSDLPPLIAELKEIVPLE